jgi:hypothetical protein
VRVVFIGVPGSGKLSLAFGSLHSEALRRAPSFRIARSGRDSRLIPARLHVLAEGPRGDLVADRPQRVEEFAWEAMNLTCVRHPPITPCQVPLPHERACVGVALDATFHKHEAVARPFAEAVSLASPASQPFKRRGVSSFAVDLLYTSPEAFDRASNDRQRKP